VVAAFGGASPKYTDAPGNQLGELIDQLVEGAERVRGAHGRLRSWLHAFEAVTDELSLDGVLRNLSESAASLTGAGHSAVAVVGSDGRVEHVVHTGGANGVGPDLGRRPDGTGLLDQVLRELRPVRLPGAAGNSGAEAGHGPVSLLGTPILVHDDLFGVLVLTDSATGEFSLEDEELVGSLASAAGTAIAHARLYDESRLQRDWLKANAAISQQILSADGQDPLELVAQFAKQIADADLVFVALLSEDASEVVVEVAQGRGGEEFVGRRFDVEGTLAGRAIAEGGPFLVTDHAHEDSFSQHNPTLAARLGPVMVVPLVGSQRTWGTLTLLRGRQRRTFSGGDLQLAADFANHVSIALELAEARATEQRMHVLEDRERIARDLHDHVIQELFAIGLSLESVAAQPGLPDGSRSRLQHRVEDLDRTIRRIRTSIFALRGTVDGAPDELRHAVMEIAGELAPLLGFAPEVQFAGAPGMVSNVLVDDVVAVVREGLTNVARHAGATSASVDLTATPTELVVTVADDGGGCTSPPWHSGIANLSTRAERRGGRFTVEPGASRGTVLTWGVPLS
jgi:signal transduction histidine kinase